MSLMSAIQVLKAAADPTRLRLLALLANGEASVGELQEILEQSQPRVSRHLRLLDEAGLVKKYRDGHWVYYRLASVSSLSSSTLVDEALALVGIDDESVARDRTALDRVKDKRERDAFKVRALNSVDIAERPSAESLAEAVDECIGDRQLNEVLDIGCGGGALLRMLGRRARRVVGIDVSRRMRLLARSRMHRAGLANCTVRNGDLVNLPFEVTGLREACRVLRPTGQLLIADRVRPIARQLPGQRGGARLIENQLTAMLCELGYRVEQRIWFPGRIMEYALFAAVPDNAQRRTGTYD